MGWIAKLMGDTFRHVVKSWQTRGVHNVPLPVEIEDARWSDMTDEEKATAADAMHRFYSTHPDDPDFEQAKTEVAATLKRVRDK